jgi:hypothetical protein
LAARVVSFPRINLLNMQFLPSVALTHFDP